MRSVRTCLTMLVMVGALLSLWAGVPGAAVAADGGGIRGVVTDGTGAPVADAWVHIGLFDGNSTQGLLTDAAGRYELALPPGAYTVAANAPDTDVQGVHLVDDGIDAHVVSAGQWLTLDHRLFRGAPVTGRVLDGQGQPVPGAAVAAVAVDGSRTVPYTDRLVTDADGRYTVPRVPPGTYRLVANRDGFATAFWPDGGFDFEGEEFEVVDDTEVALDEARLRRPGSISGRLVADGYLEMPRAVLLRPDQAGRFQLVAGYPAGVPDESGRFEFTDLPPSRYWLRAGSVDYVEYWPDSPTLGGAVPIDLVEGQRLELPDLALRPGSVVGTVVTGDGQPAVQLELHLERQEGARWLMVGETHTDGTGGYAFGELSPGRHRVSFLDEATYRRRTVEVDVEFGGTPARVDARLHRRGTLSGTVRWPDGAPAAGVSVVLFGRRHGVWVPAFGVDPGPIGQATDSSGRYRFELSDNLYRVGVAQAAGLQPQVFAGGTTVDTAGDQPVVAETDRRVDVVVPRPGAISGRVTDETGRPIEGVTVRALQRAGESSSPRARTDLDGRYVIDHVHPGEYRVVAAVDGRVSEVYPDSPLELTGLRRGARVVVASGATRSGTDLDLTKGSTLRSTFASRTHDRIREADVELFWRDRDRWVSVDRGGGVTQTRLPAGQYRLAYRAGLASGAQVAAGYGRLGATPRPDGRDITLDGVHSARVRTVVDPRGVLSGRVARPGPETKVAVERRVGSRWRAVTVVGVHRTESKTIYATPRLSPGRYRLRLSGPLRFSTSVVAEVPRTRHVRRDVTMPGFTWSGRTMPARVGMVVNAVRPDGSVAARARVGPGADGMTGWVVGPLRKGERYTFGVHDPTGRYEDFFLGPTEYGNVGRYFLATWVTSLADAQFVTVRGDVPWAEFNGSAGPGPVLHGRLLRPDGAAWDGATVHVLAVRDGEPDLVRSTTTTDRGFWRADGLPPGAYRLRYDVRDEDTLGPVLQVDGGCLPEDGRAVVVGTDGLVDAGPVRLGARSNRPRAEVAPEVSGAAVVGEQLAVTRGRWSPCDVEVRHEWLRDGRSVVGATGSSYRVQEADRGHRLSVRTTVVAVHYQDEAPRFAFTTTETAVVG